MSNTWKARCVKESSGWEIGDIFEVLNGVVLYSMSHSWGGSKSREVQSFENWRKFQKHTEWELISNAPTLRDHINQLSNKEFAEMIVDIDSDFEHYITTDDATWYDREDAIKHQIELLESAYDED